MEKFEKAEQEQVIRDMQATFATESGARVLKFLRKYCMQDEKTDVFYPLNERQTCYNLGALNVYRYIKCLVNYDLSKLQTQECIMETKNE